MTVEPSVNHIGTTGRRRDGSIVLAAMYAGYAVSMALRMVVPIAGAAIRGDPRLGIDLDRWGKIISIGISGAIIGKLLCGYLADRFGGKWTFVGGLLLTAVFVASSSPGCYRIVLGITGPRSTKRRGRAPRGRIRWMARRSGRRFPLHFAAASSG